ncbi:serine/threonine-protein kinase [Cohnella sp. AR92]|uniref:serine/threonine protein kinase n=1 Tax=Cohnella sp. AR92 TaxID=648716 RepID=UPI000F8E60FA|nr:serine/threonine-protein kinase [Cohnella sp. AR92]RUS44927.1 serine/threonine protein kinase [Cohnella sp. AR92]
MTEKKNMIEIKPVAFEAPVFYFVRSDRCLENYSIYCFRGLVYIGQKCKIGSINVENRGAAMTEWHEKYNGHRINGGSFGVIYEVEGMPNVVIKALNPDPDLGSAEDRRRMQREIAILNQLNGSPNIIPITDYEIEAVCPWYMMPKATMNLSDYVEQHGQLDEEVTITLTMQILTGLQAAHEISILHRDLGPHNILLFQRPDAPLPDVWVADFGLGRDHKRNSKALTRSVDTHLGHASFISPEQYEALANANIQSDIYSVGALMTYMVTGKDPLRTRIESGLLDITLELMQQNPKRRPADTQAVFTMLEQYLRIRNPQRIRSSIQEIGFEFQVKRTLTHEQVVDLSDYLTKNNRIYTGGNQGDLTYDTYFEPLLNLPPGLVLTWAQDYASPENVETFLDRFEEQLEQIAYQTRWTFRSMYFICDFIMSLFDIDKVKGRITSLVAYAYSRGFGEASISLNRIVIGRYEDNDVVIKIARALAKYADRDNMKSFMDDKSSSVRHAAFMDAYL